LPAKFNAPRDWAGDQSQPEPLWHLDEFDVEVQCERLFALALLLGLDLNSKRMRLHDVVRTYLIGESRAAMRALHRRLLSCHRPPSSDWADLPLDEPYMWGNLAFHMTEAALEEELVATVKDLRYLATKSVARGSAAAESDLLAAERLAPRTDCCRCCAADSFNPGTFWIRLKNSRMPKRLSTVESGALSSSTHYANRSRDDCEGRISHRYSCFPICPIRPSSAPSRVIEARSTPALSATTTPSSSLPPRITR
jgi:hypothetical protein